jgi:hypothetical protein
MYWHILYLVVLKYFAKLIRYMVFSNCAMRDMSQLKTLLSDLWKLPFYLQKSWIVTDTKEIWTEMYGKCSIIIRGFIIFILVSTFSLISHSSYQRNSFPTCSWNHMIACIRTEICISIKYNLSWSEGMDFSNLTRSVYNQVDVSVVKDSN